MTEFTDIRTDHDADIDLVDEADSEVVVPAMHTAAEPLEANEADVFEQDAIVEGDEEYPHTD